MLFIATCQLTCMHKHIRYCGMPYKVTCGNQDKQPPAHTLHCNCGFTTRFCVLSIYTQIILLLTIIPRACARGKVIGCCQRRQHENRQISRSASCNHNESVDIGEKLTSVRFEQLNMAHKRYKSCIFCSACLWFTDRTHSAPCAFCSCAQLQLR